MSESSERRQSGALRRQLKPKTVENDTTVKPLFKKNDLIVFTDFVKRHDDDKLTYFD